MVPVGRPREFDEREVLERALEVFWERGYEATSVADLLEATGLKKGSLYQAFGDKREFFLRALEHYVRRGEARVQARLEGEGPLRVRLREALSSTCTDPNRKRGCFAVNCLVELAPHDPQVRALIARHFRSIERLVEAAIERGVQAGEVQAKAPPAQLARLLQTVLTGAAAASKGHLSASEASAVVELALYSLI